MPNGEQHPLKQHGYTHIEGVDPLVGAEIKALLEALTGANRLVATAIQRLDNLGVTPSAAQWGYLAALDHGRLVLLITALTDTDWVGGAHGSEEADIDLSAFGSGCPSGIKAVLVSAFVRDSASANNSCDFGLGPGGIALVGGQYQWFPMQMRLKGVPNDYTVQQQNWIPCDEDGNIRYRTGSTGADCMDVWLYIWGYVLGE